MEQARKRFIDAGIKNISTVQGDVGNLPFSDEQFDIVLSMNGFHAFPDKEKAFSETHRVLEKDGLFVSCFYIQGKSHITDFLVKNILAKKGWFTPPFDTETFLRKRLETLYNIVELHVEGSMVYFAARKK